MKPWIHTLLNVLGVLATFAFLFIILLLFWEAGANL